MREQKCPKCWNWHGIPGPCREGATIQAETEYDVLFSCQTQKNLNIVLDWLGKHGYPLGGILNRFGYVHVGPVTWSEANKICEAFPQYRPLIDAVPTQIK